MLICSLYHRSRGHFYFGERGHFYFGLTRRGESFDKTRDWNRMQVQAELAELADAHVSGACDREVIRVQVPGSALFMQAKPRSAWLRGLILRRRFAGL